MLKKLLTCTAGLALLALICIVPVHATTHQVIMQNLQFIPSAVEVAYGDTVKWTNQDPVQHTTTRTATPKMWDSGPLGPGQSFFDVFVAVDGPGPWTYECTIHLGMTGVIRLTPLGACCAPGGACTITSQANCPFDWKGAGTTCNPNPCVTTNVFGACCLPNGGCAYLTAAECAGAGGIYRGDNIPCSQADCDHSTEPTGACCIPSTGQCVNTTASKCQ